MTADSNLHDAILGQLSIYRDLYSARNRLADLKLENVKLSMLFKSKKELNDRRCMQTLQKIEDVESFKKIISKELEKTNVKPQQVESLNKDDPEKLNDAQKKKILVAKDRCKKEIVKFIMKQHNKTLEEINRWLTENLKLKNKFSSKPVKMPKAPGKAIHTADEKMFDYLETELAVDNYSDLGSYKIVPHKKTESTTTKPKGKKTKSKDRTDVTDKSSDERKKNNKGEGAKHKTSVSSKKQTKPSRKPKLPKIDEAEAKVTQNDVHVSSEVRLPMTKAKGGKKTKPKKKVSKSSDIVKSDGVLKVHKNELKKTGSDQSKRAKGFKKNDAAIIGGSVGDAIHLIRRPIAVTA